MLRPVDIQSKTFDKKIKGFDPDQVDDFLDRIIHDYELILKENQSMKDKISVMEESLKHYRLIEGAMEKSVETARESANGIIENAKAEADNIIERAKLSAQKLAKQIDIEHERRQLSITEMETELNAFRARIRAMCGSIIEASEKI